jgi:hypothetical protein
LVNFTDFVELIDKHCEEIANSNCAKGSIEDYCLNHLRKLSVNAHSSEHASDVSNSVKFITRFTSDSVEWNSDLMIRITKIVEYHSALLKSDTK